MTIPEGSFFKIGKSDHKVNYYLERQKDKETIAVDVKGIKIRVEKESLRNALIDHYTKKYWSWIAKPITEYKLGGITGKDDSCQPRKFEFLQDIGVIKGVNGERINNLEELTYKLRSVFYRNVTSSNVGTGAKAPVVPTYDNQIAMIKRLQGAESALERAFQALKQAHLKIFSEDKNRFTDNPLQIGLELFTGDRVEKPVIERKEYQELQEAAEEHRRAAPADKGEAAKKEKRAERKYLNAQAPLDVKVEYLVLEKAREAYINARKAYMDAKIAFEDRQVQPYIDPKKVTRKDAEEAVNEVAAQLQLNEDQLHAFKSLNTPEAASLVMEEVEKRGRQALWSSKGDMAKEMEVARAFDKVEAYNRRSIQVTTEFKEALREFRNLLGFQSELTEKEMEGLDSIEKCLIAFAGLVTRTDNLPKKMTQEDYKKLKNVLDRLVKLGKEGKSNFCPNSPTIPLKAFGEAMQKRVG